MVKKKSAIVLIALKEGLIKSRTQGSGLKPVLCKRGSHHDRHPRRIELCLPCPLYARMSFPLLPQSNQIIRVVVEICLGPLAIADRC